MMIKYEEVSFRNRKVGVLVHEQGIVDKRKSILGNGTASQSHQSWLKTQGYESHLKAMQIIPRASRQCTRFPRREKRQILEMIIRQGSHGRLERMKRNRKQ